MTRTVLPWLLLDAVLLAVILLAIRSNHPAAKPALQPVAFQPESRHYVP
ncbi:hypothetical protein LVJ94_17695 [Pendulispora rubella]|uniref:Uncharacterized protein n=1 Tax=Pendulispora rubella TaxID=2741070 RepID=A0ABZ2LDP8_9BACT